MYDTTMDPRVRMAKVESNPVRLAILDVLRQRVASPVELSMVCPRFRRHLTAWVERLRQGGVDATYEAAIPTGVPSRSSPAHSHLGALDRSGSSGNHPGNRRPTIPRNLRSEATPRIAWATAKGDQLLVCCLAGRSRARDRERVSEHVGCDNKGLQRCCHLVLQSRGLQGWRPFLYR